jgi:pentatricopeptide repeat protein
MESSLTIGGSQPNSVTYSAAIIACARLADWQRAIELKDQMLARCALALLVNAALLTGLLGCWAGLGCHVAPAPETCDARTSQPAL